MMVSRFDGGANQPLKTRNTTMLTTTDKIIKHKTGLLNLAEELGNVSSISIRPQPVSTQTSSLCGIATCWNSA